MEIFCRIKPKSKSAQFNKKAMLDVQLLCTNSIWRRCDMHSVNEYLVIEIADTDVWVPIADARSDVTAKKHVNMFLSPYTNKTTETTKIPYPMACCAVAKSNIFLMTWLICNPLKMNAKHAKAETTINIPIAIGIQRNVTSIFSFNLVSKFESNQVYLMDAIILMYYQHLADRRVCWVAIETKLSCLNGLIKGLRRKHTQKGILWMLKGVRKPTLCSKCLCSHKFI